MTVRRGMGVFYTTSQAPGHIGLARLYWKVVWGFFAVCLSARYLSQPFFQCCVEPQRVHCLFFNRSAATGHSSPQ